MPASSSGPARATSPRRTSCRCCRGERRNRATWTTNGAAPTTTGPGRRSRPPPSRFPRPRSRPPPEGRPASARPACTVRVRRSSTISMPASLVSTKSSAWWRRARASSLASSRMRWATELAWRTISVRCTMCSAWARTSSISASASRVRSAMNSSRSRSSQRAWRSSSGSASSAACTSEVTSSRDTITDEDSGIDFAAAMRSSNRWRIDSIPPSSTGGSSSTSRNWSLTGPRPRRAAPPRTWPPGAWPPPGARRPTRHPRSAPPRGPAWKR